MVNAILLTNPGINSGNSVRLLGAILKYGWKNLIEKQTIPNLSTPSHTQKYGFENPSISLDFYIPIDDIPSGSMTHTMLLTFAKNKYFDNAGTRTTLTVTYGKNSSPFFAYDGTSTSIIVEIDSFDISFDTRDSYQGNVLNCSIIMHEVI